MFYVLLFKLHFLFTENSDSDLQDNEVSLPNISTGFFDRHRPFEDNVMKDEYRATVNNSTWFSNLSRVFCV